ncbi:aminotransferase class III-fold pyridoxal phosphate-dependent enzyme [Ancylomarina euxinus]|uniref:Aminotransferase class III-fold pyridoxal phosphate-dependent enzyme n=1 Tax=Ancylomarina euxinus TaxID=2283627 RepID=A0A425Y2M0_9BACT|nr:aspartate aminotransferase family protein [Ancylomarina euxinus]MCZ4694979.1 aspartate aminotransferase family protein [Ancylomarina euxinus]MUP14844.1 aminotransferase class III-fold pyridoxal phosphate-dependent enzyme [Ancylomarina euxinus]RRG22187.1 aminotransferase class III-fold pyridoxal phosphate-dependent enzyme [Ancylomarina euxinus]
MDTDHINSLSHKRTSEEIYNQACKIIPGGVSRNTIFHHPYPHYISHANGCYATDINNIQRLDFGNNMAALIHGHAHPDIVDAVIKQIRKGTAYTMATEAEVLYAQLLCDRTPSFEKIRFVNSGTEAVMAMIKTARAYTGRPKIAKAEGAYHGTYDFAEVSQTANPANWGDINQPNSVPVANGTPQSVLNDVIIFPYNDIEHTLAILDQNASEIACVIIDPVPHRVGLMEGKTNFIEAIYEWTRKNGALLAFDEVVTYRVNYGGAQQNYSVKPDLTALGKIIGGGFPVGAFAGRSDIMKVLDPRESKLLFPHSGTFSANPVSMTAGHTTMKMYNKDAILKLNTLTQKATDQIREAIKIADVPVSITGTGSMFRLHLKPSAPTSYREAYQNCETKTLINEMLDYLFLDEKIMMINTLTCMFSTVMTQKEIDMLSQALLNMFKRFKTQLHSLDK